MRLLVFILNAISQTKGNHDPAFAVFYQRANNEYCYYLNRKQLGQYWRCIVEDTNFLCSSRCERCKACKEMSHVFVELQDSYFFIPNTKVANNYEDKPYQPVIWCVYNRPSNKKEFRIEIAKSIPDIGLVMDNGQTC